MRCRIGCKENATSRWSAPRLTRAGYRLQGTGYSERACPLSPVTCHLSPRRCSHVRRCAFGFFSPAETRTPPNSLPVVRTRGHAVLRSGTVPDTLAVRASGAAGLDDCRGDSWCCRRFLRADALLCVGRRAAATHAGVALGRGHAGPEPARLPDLPCLFCSENRRLEARRHSVGLCR